MARYQLWDWDTNKTLAEADYEETALLQTRHYLCVHESGTINRLGLVDKGGPGEVLTYPLEGSALLAKAFGLEEADE